MTRAALLVITPFVLAAAVAPIVSSCMQTNCTETQTCPDSPTGSSDGALLADITDAINSDASNVSSEPAADGEAGETSEGIYANPDTEAAMASPDASPPEDGAPRDGPAESADADGAPTGYCDSLVPAPVFCDDFDEHALPGAWATLREVGGTLTRDTTVFVSPPNSLLAHNNALSSGQPLDTAVRSQLTLPPAPMAIALEFQWQPATADTSAGAATVIAALDLIDSANNRYTLQFALVQQGVVLSVRLEEQSGFADGATSYASHPLPDPVTISAWTHVRLVVKRTSARAASARVFFNGTLELDAPLAVTVDATTLQLAIGSSFETEPSNGWTNRYDNVRLDFQ